MKLSSRSSTVELKTLLKVAKLERDWICWLQTENGNSAWNSLRNRAETY